MSGKGGNRYDVYIRQLRAEQAEREAWDALEPERRENGRKRLEETLEAQRQVSPVDVPALTDREFWNEAERRHGHAPAGADLGAIAQDLARSRRQDGRA